MQVKLHVGNLPDRCSTDSLRDMFGPYGEITSIAVIKNFAFVNYSNKSDADKAMEDLHKTKLLGKEITVNVAKLRPEGRDNRDNRDSRDNRDNRRQLGGRDDRRQSNRNGFDDPMRNGGLGGIAALGGILGAAPSAVPGLGLLTSLNAAVAGQIEQSREQQREQPMNTSRAQPDPDVRVRREVVHTRDVPQAAKLGLGSGYVIHERYYVDASHPLLKGLPLTVLPRLSDIKHSTIQDSYPEDAYRSRQDGFQDRRDYGDHRERSPIQSRDFDYSRY